MSTIDDGHLKAAAAENPVAPRYTADELERIIRRAAELQSLTGDGEPPAFSEAELIRIGADVGIAAEHVQAALSELQARSQLHDDEEDHPLLTWLFGGAMATVTRRISGTREQVQADLEQQLEQEQSLQPVRRAPGLSVWEPSGDLGDMVQRMTDFSGRRYRLVEAETVSLNLIRWDRDNVLVRLAADLSDKRSGWMGGWGIGIGIGLLVLWSFLGSAWWSWSLLALLGITAGVVALLDIRRSLRRERRKFSLALDGMLDRVSSAGK